MNTACYFTVNDDMDDFMSANPEVRTIPEVPDEFVHLSNTVGSDWSDLIARSRELDYKGSLVVSTPAQMTRP